MLPALLEVLLDAWMGIHLCWTCGVSIICVGMQEKHLLDSGLMWLCRCHHGQDRFKHAVCAQTIAQRPVQPLSADGVPLAGGGCYVQPGSGGHGRQVVESAHLHRD